MSNDTVLLLIVGISIAIIPGIAIYSKWKNRQNYLLNKRKMADFFEKAADEQIKTKDGPE